MEQQWEIAKAATTALRSENEKELETELVSV
jgi:hypothetical protein